MMCPSHSLPTTELYREPSVRIGFSYLVAVKGIRNNLSFKHLIEHLVCTNKLVNFNSISSVLIFFLIPIMHFLQSKH